MSNTANWSYTNTATVRPFIAKDTRSQAHTYGEPYTIACTWAADGGQARDANGQEFIGKHVIWTEDARPKYLDLIQLNGQEIWEEIRQRMYWDMSFFSEEPDYRLTTV